jgi:hypothetical protein
MRLPRQVARARVPNAAVAPATAPGIRLSVPTVEATMAPAPVTIGTRAAMPTAPRLAWANEFATPETKLLPKLTPLLTADPARLVPTVAPSCPRRSRSTSTSRVTFRSRSSRSISASAAAVSASTEISICLSLETRSIFFSALRVSASTSTVASDFRSSASICSRHLRAMARTSTFRNAASIPEAIFEVSGSYGLSTET